ncbi:MAG: trigger factor [Prochlorotrichaceae cyanobacterium]|jgi:trigger factor
MKVTQEKLPGSQVNLSIELPANLTQSAYEKALQKLSKQVRVSGFRPGKVPRKVLIQQLGMSRIKAYAIETLLEGNVSKAFKEADVRPIGQYDIRPTFDILVGEFEPNQPLSFTVVVDVVPTVTLNEYQGMTVQAESVPYDSTQVDNVITHYRKQASTLLPVEESRPAQAGDVAVLDYEGFFVLPQDAPEGSEPEPIPQAKGNDAQVDLQEGNFIPGFIDGVIGMTPGESHDVSATFPDDYPAEELAGKAAVFQVTLKELKVRELPDLDDDFAQRISQYASYEELVAGLETRYKQEAEEQEHNNKVQACVQKLVENVEAEFPQTLIDEQCNILMQQMLNQFSQQGIDLRQLDASFADKLRQAVEPEAIDELKRRFGLLQLAKLEKIDVDLAAVKERMGEILSAIDNPKKVDINRLQTIAEDELMQEACMEWLLEHNTIEMVPPGTLTPEEDLEEDLAEETEDAAEATVEVIATESEEA